jgi:hypothetical protein
MIGNMNKLANYNFNEIYDLAAIIDHSAKFEESFFKYDKKVFMDRATKFSKKTLLPLYITSKALHYFGNQFKRTNKL